MVVMLKRVPDSKIRLNKMATYSTEKQQAEWNETIDKLLEKDPTRLRYWRRGEMK